MLIPRGFKTRQEYLRYVKEAEKELYRNYEDAGYFKRNEIRSNQWTQITKQDKFGLVRDNYYGQETRQYSRPMFEVCLSFCKNEEDGEFCVPCDDRWWCMEDSVGVIVHDYPVFDEDNRKRVKPIKFDSNFAASRSHP